MLRKLLLRKRIEEINNKLAEITSRQKTIKEEETKLVEEIENSTEEMTDEERVAVTDEADKFEKEKQELLDKKKELEKELEEINQELKELEEKDNEVVGDDEKDVVTETSERKLRTKLQIGGNNMKHERREQLRQLIANDNNKKFFDEVRELVMRAETTLTGKELLIPKDVVTAINQEIIGYGNVIKLVHRIPIKGNTRIVFNAGTPKLFWTEKCASLQEATLGELKEIELDNFKLGGYVFLCKAFVEDAVIDIADYIIKEFAKAIAIALDEAIINGEGSEQKQPEGITKVVTDLEVKNVSNLVQVLGLVGTLDPRAKNIALVTNRATYYSRILPETYGKDSKGKIVYGLGQTLPDGTKIVISEAVKKADEFIIGDFYNGYKLGERKGMTFDSSDQVRWIEEQIGYKTSGRYDGKVAGKEFFVRGKFVDSIGG